MNKPKPRSTTSDKLNAAATVIIALVSVANLFGNAEGVSQMLTRRQTGGISVPKAPQCSERSELILGADEIRAVKN